jgi:hypothetical protein
MRVQEIQQKNLSLPGGNGGNVHAIRKYQLTARH